MYRPRSEAENSTMGHRNIGRAAGSFGLAALLAAGGFGIGAGTGHAAGVKPN